MTSDRSRRFRLLWLGRRYRALLIGMMLLAMSGVSSSPARSDDTCLRYDQIQQRFIHNAFSTIVDPVDEQILDQLVYHRIRALELDLMPGTCDNVTQYPPSPDWYIYHYCGDHTKTTISLLSQALQLLRAFHDAQPQHEVVTINFELGSNKSEKGGRPEFAVYSPDDLDKLLRDYLGDALFTPADLLALNPGAQTLFEAVKPRVPGGPSGWPTSDELRGKFIFIAHGEANDLDRYFGPSGAKAQGRVCFKVDEGFWKDLTPERFASEHPYLLFHSEVPTKDVASQLRQSLPGHVFRSRQIDDCNLQDCRGDTNRARVAEAQRAGMQMLYMNMGSAIDPAFRTVNDNFYPFGASVVKADGTYPVGDESWQHPAVVGKTEPGRIFILGDKSGGDLDNAEDEFTFAIAPGAGQSQSWTAEIASISNVTVHPHGKAFLMARASTAATAPYCAVGRTADRYGMRIQYRSDFDLGTAFEEQFGNYGTADDENRRERENWHFARLDVIPTDGGQSTLCRAYVSYTGRKGTWQRLGSDMTFPGIALSSVGLSVSSNSGFNADNVQTYYPGTYTKIFFVDLQRGVGGGLPEPVDLAALQVTGVGGSSDPYVRRISQPALTCVGAITTDSEPGLCGAHVDLSSATSGHCGTVVFSPASGSLFEVGTTTVTASTQAAASCSFGVTVKDAQKPAVDVSLATPLLALSSHELVNVGLSGSASDNCGGLSPDQLAVYSDEDDETDGSFSPDARDVAPGTLRLRAEAEKKGNGRVYLLVVSAADAAGNTAAGASTVVVPRSQSPADIEAVNAEAAAAAAFFLAQGVPPPGFVVVGDGPVIGPKQ